MEENLESGEVVEPTSAAELLRILECPVCTEVPLPPIFCCTRGHIVCNTCRTQLQTCVTCQSPFSQSRNFVMENIVETSKFRCKYRDNGCHELITGDLAMVHFTKCKYRKGPLSAVRRSGRVHDLTEKIVPSYEWKSYDKSILTNAVSDTTKDGSQVYLVHAKHPSGAVVPGKLEPRTELALISWNAVDLHTKDFQILVAVPESLTWTGYVHGKLPDHAVIGGRDDLGGALYVGRRFDDEGKVSFGYVFRDQDVCYVSTNGAVFMYKNFEVLVKNAKGIEIDQSNN